MKRRVEIMALIVVELRPFAPGLVAAGKLCVFFDDATPYHDTT